MIGSFCMENNGILNRFVILMTHMPIHEVIKIKINKTEYQDCQYKWIDPNFWVP